LANKRFRGLSQAELNIGTAIFTKIYANMEQMTQELKTVKTVLQVPRLRADLRNYDLKGLNYQGLLGKIDELTYDVKGQMIGEDALLPTDKVYAEQARERATKHERTKFMDQTGAAFNMT
jgi:hypothetical protein